MSKLSTQNNIPLDWQQVKLGEIGKVSMCKRVLKSQTLPIGDVPFYKIGTFGNTPDAFISKNLYEEYKNKYSYPKKGEILISASGTIGRTVVYDGELAYFQDSNIIWISNDESKVLNKFLNYILKRVKWETSSGTIARIYNDGVREIKFSIPSLTEQRRIILVIESWDKAIENLSKKIEAKKQIKNGLIQELFSGIKRIDGFAEKWKKEKLSDIFTIKKGVGLSKEKLDNSGKYECILYGELYTTYSEVIYSIKSKTNADEGTLSKTGDILIPASTTTGAIDLAVAACLQKGGVLLGGDINILRPKDKLDSRFFAYYLTHAKKHTLARLAQGVTIVHLYASDFKDIKIEIPKLEEQKKIADIITTAEKEIVELEKKLEIFEEQKRYLLNNLITGTIRTPETLSTKVTK